MKEIDFHPDAIIDLKESIYFYEDKYKSLGKDFLNEVIKAVIEIQKSPQRFPTKTKSTRHCLLSKFPYSVVYLELKEKIFIIAVAHWKRKPNYWKKRLA